MAVTPYRTAPLVAPRRPRRWPWRVADAIARLVSASAVVGTLTGLCAPHGCSASVVCVCVVAACAAVRAWCDGRMMG